jgi:cytosine/adenosine deaminase-related metal-dependent hydrolase
MPLDGRLAFPGFVDTHIHLDKSCIWDRCRCERGTLQEAIAAVAAAKAAFTEDDIYARAQRTLERAIVQSTTHAHSCRDRPPHRAEGIRRDPQAAVVFVLAQFLSVDVFHSLF